MTTYCAPGALFPCSRCGTARTRPEYLQDGACKETEWCEKQLFRRAQEAQELADVFPAGMQWVLNEAKKIRKNRKKSQ